MCAVHCLLVVGPCCLGQDNSQFARSLGFLSCLNGFDFFGVLILVKD